MVSFGVFFCGLALTGREIISCYKIKQLAQIGIHAEGTITSLTGLQDQTQRHVNKPSVEYRPVFTFKNDKEQIIKATDPLSTVNAEDIKIGNRVSVLYDRENPENAMIKQDIEDIKKIYDKAVFGLSCIIAGFISWIFALYLHFKKRV